MTDKVDTLPDFTSDELLEAIEWLREQGFLSDEQRPFEKLLHEARGNEDWTDPTPITPMRSGGVRALRSDDKCGVTSGEPSRAQRPTQPHSEERTPPLGRRPPTKGSGG